MSKKGILFYDQKQLLDLGLFFSAETFRSFIP